MKNEGLLDIGNDPDAKEFKDHLKEAVETDLTDIERTGCVTAGRDLKKNLVFVMMPSLGFKTHEKQEVVLRRMLLLFIRKANEMIEEAYTIVYAHAAIDIMNQYPLIYKFYSILPRAYKKNLQKMYIIHPNYGIKMFFEFARVFLSQKFYSKLVLLDSIFEFQKVIPPTALSLPLKFLKKEDDDRGLKYCGFLAPLTDAYLPELGTTQALSVCTQFIRARGGITHAGIFRVPGDEAELILCKVRLQYASQGMDRIFLSENKDLILIGDIDSITSMSKPSSTNSKKESGKRGSVTSTGSNSSQATNENAASLLPPEAPTSIIVISNINSVAQIFKMSIRDLPESLIPYSTYRSLIDTTRKYEVNDLNHEWEQFVVHSLAELHVSHLSTLVHVVCFLREIIAECEVNKMDSKNIAIIFAPTIFRPDMLDPVKAIMELKLAQVLVKEIIDRHSILYEAVGLMRANVASKPVADHKLILTNVVFDALPVPAPRVHRTESEHIRMKAVADSLAGMDVSSDPSLEAIGHSLSPSMLGRLGRGRVKSTATAPVNSEMNMEITDGEPSPDQRYFREQQHQNQQQSSDLEQVDN